MKPVRLAGLPGFGLGVLALAATLPGLAVPISAGQVDNIASVPRVSIEEFKKLLEAEGVIVMDVRSPQAYRQGHIPGAISVPLETVEARAAEWRNAAKPIVTYCTWPAEQTSARAALTLIKAGVKDVRALLGGYAAWVPNNKSVVGTEAR